ncbi:MAG: hypothetical protein RMX35_30750 [Nostoc sp. DcaGUA01]|nr:hypothetical protein [Nostoc sp. DcaGUA01]
MITRSIWLSRWRDLVTAHGTKLSGSTPTYYPKSNRGNNLNIRFFLTRSHFKTNSEARSHFSCRAATIAVSHGNTGF